MHRARLPRSPRAVPLLAAALVGGSVLVAPVGVRAEEPGGGSAALAEAVVGELVQAWPEYEDRQEAQKRGAEGPLSWVRPVAGTAVRIPTEDLARTPQATAGATVSVTLGGEVRDQATVQDGLEPARDVVSVSVLAAAPAASIVSPTSPPAPSVTHAVTVVRMLPAGGVRDATALADVVAAVNGPVADFWAGESNGSIRIHVTAESDWFQGQTDCSTPEALFAEAAAHASWTRGPGKHLMVYLPRESPGCEYGLGEVGTSTGDGGVFYVTDSRPSPIAHELGHNFGLGHASALVCDAAVDTPPCDLLPYADLYDVMGFAWDQVGSLNSPHAHRLGVLPSTRVTSVAATSGGGTYTLAPVHQASGKRALRLTDADGDAYWLEYRAAGGRDAWLRTSDNFLGLQTGVLLRLAGDGDDTSLLLDGTPLAFDDPLLDLRTALPPVTVVPIADGDFAISVLGVTSTGASVRIMTPARSMRAAHTASGGAGGPLGAAVGDPSCGVRGGCTQSHQHGAVTWTARTGARVVTGVIAREWTALGGAGGKLGYPLAGADCRLAQGSCVQLFEGGRVYWEHGQARARAVWGSIFHRYLASGAERGPLGLPVSGELCGLRDGGCYQRFERGSVYFTRATGARLVTTPKITARWRELGYENGRLGYPVSDSICGLRDGGCFQHFQGGSLYASNLRTTAFVVKGAIRDRWAAGGWETGQLGYPLTDERCGLTGGGCYQRFVGGSVYWSPATGARAVRGAIRARWGSLGWERGSLGYPLSEEICGLRNGGCFQVYQRGSLYWSPASGAHPVSGAIQAAWGRAGWEAGSLGYPTRAAYAVSGGVAQRFQGGTLTWNSATGRVRRS